MFTSDNLLATTDPALPAPTTMKSYSGRICARLMGSFDSHSKDSFKYDNVDSNNVGTYELVIMMSRLFKNKNKYNNT